MAVMAAGEVLALGTPSEIKSGVRSADIPEPGMEDAFIILIRKNEQERYTS
jgi:ABC-2 type transport system ATP-binding protein